MARLREAQQAERYVQVGMRAVIRDLQVFIADHISRDYSADPMVRADHVNAYLLALLITAGGYEGEPGDGQG